MPPTPDDPSTDAQQDMLGRIADRRVRPLLLLFAATLALIALALLLSGRSAQQRGLLIGIVGAAALVLALLAWAAQRGRARRVMFPAMVMLCVLVGLDAWLHAGAQDNGLLALPALLLAAAIGSARPAQLLGLLGANLINVALLHAAARFGWRQFDPAPADAAAVAVSLLLLGCSGLLVALLVHDLRRLAGAWGREHLRAEASSERAAYLVDHDPLTGLPNRAQAQQRLRAAVAAGEDFTLLLIDIADFSAINAALGAEVGDEVLCHLAAQLPSPAARFGDDEFLLLLPASAEAQAEALLQQLAAPWQALELDLQVRLLGGLARYPAHGRDADALLAAAQQALAAAKREPGRALRSAAEHDGPSRSSLRADEAEWRCLPWQALDSGEVRAVELLSAEAPLDALPVPALLAQMQRQLRAAAQHALAWRLAGHPQLALRLRLPRDFLKRGDVEAALQQVLDAGGLPATQLELLIGLDSAAENPQALADLLDPLLRAGARLLVRLDALPATMPPLQPLPVQALVLSAAAQQPAAAHLGWPLQAAELDGEAALRRARELGCDMVAAQPLEFLVLLEHLGDLR